MSQMWLDKLEAATSQVERDEILLREVRAMGKAIRNLDNVQRDRLLEDIEEQLRALASRALTVI